MKLTLNNFFHFYIIHPNSNELSPQERTKAKIFSAILAVFSLGITHLICKLAFYDRSFKIKKPQEEPKISTVAKIIQSEPILREKKEAKLEDKTIHQEILSTSVEEIVKPTKIKERLPALPPIFNFSIEALTSPWKPTHQKMGISEYEFNSIGLNEQIINNNPLLSTPLSSWIQLKDDQKTNPYAHLIDERINNLDEAIQLKERLKRLNDPLDLRLSDLLPSWKNSKLRYCLMMDDEVTQLKVDAVKNLDTFLPESFIKRIKDLSKANSPSEFQLDKESIVKMPLINISSLKASQINEFAAYLPSFAVDMVAPEELSSLDFNKLTANQIQRILGSTDQVQKVFQIKIPEEVEVITTLSKSLEYAKIQELMAKLSLDTIYKIAKHLPSYCLSLMTETQALNFDFSKVENKKVVFNLVFDPHGFYGAKRLSKMSLDKIYSLEELFTEKQWAFLNEEQALNFDFTKIKNPQSVFDALFKITYQDYHDGLYSKATTLIPKFTMDKLYQCKKYFTKKGFWEALKEEQILKYDFLQNPLNKTVINIIFNADGGPSSQAAKLIPRLEKKQIEAIKGKLSKEALVYIPKGTL